MQTDKERAEKYVRSKCPELMELSFGCLIDWGEWGAGIKGSTTTTRPYRWFDEGDWEEELNPNTMSKTIKSCKAVIVGHPIQLQHWLSAIDTVFGQMKKSGSGTFLNVEVYESPKYEGLSHITINFNLITGQPATEADYQAFNQIVGI